MNKAVPWNINGVGFDAREAAREAARRQGKSLGEWLDGVIADHAAELGVEAHDIGGRDRIDAVTSRLERLGARAASAVKTRLDAEDARDAASTRGRPARRDRMAPIRPRPHTDERDEELEDEGPRFRRSDGARAVDRRHEERRFDRPASIIDDTEFLLEEAVDAMERRALRVERKTDQALASFAKVIETKRDDERDTVAALARKMSDMEARITSRSSDDNYRPIRGALARLEAQLETLGRRVPVEAPAAAPVTAASPPRPSEDPPAIQRLETKLNSILDAMQTSAVAASAARTRPVEPVALPVSMPPSAVEPVATPVSMPPSPVHRRLGDAIAAIADRQRALETEPGPTRSEAPRAAPERQDHRAQDHRAQDHRAQDHRAQDHRAIDALKGEISGLTAKMDELRREMLSRVAAPPVNDEANRRIDDLRGEIAKMADVVRDVAPRSALQTQITRMTTSLEDLRRDTSHRNQEARRDEAALAQVASRADLDGLKTEIAGITRTLGELAPHDKLAGLEEAIRGLTVRIEQSRETAPGENVPSPLQDAVGDLRDWLGKVDVTSTISQLERDVRAIGGKLDDLSGIDASVLSRLQDQTEDIRRMLAAGGPVAVERIEKQVATLAEKMDRQPALAARNEASFQTAADDIRALLRNPPGAALFEKIERRLEALTGKVDQAVTEASGARQVAEQARRRFDVVQEQLSTRLGADNASATGDMRSLETLVRDLSQKIDMARAPDASGQAIEALQEQIFRLSSRFEHTEGDLSAISTIERSIRDLFAHLEETRASVETSAARAAREALEVALAKGHHVDPVSAREIAALRSIQEQADQRTHATLNAVHDALEKVVDRLSVMEGDIAVARRPHAEPKIETRAESRSTPSARLEVKPEPRPTRGPSRPELPDLMLEESDALDAPLAPRRSSDRGRAPRFSPPREVPADLDDMAGRSDFIAAARRAARAAQTDPSVIAMKRPEVPVAAADLRAGLMAKTRDYVSSHKKPVLLSVAALFVLLGTIALMGPMITGDGALKVAATPTQPVKTAALSPRLPTPAPVAAPRTVTPVASPQAGGVSLADLTPSALPKAPPPSVKDALPGSDPVTTGSIPRLPSFAAQSVSNAAPVAPTGALKEMADAGNPAAQYEVASRYAEGRLLTKDFALAALWYEKAAQQGLAPAQYKLASLYEKGLGVPRDKIKAKSWYMKAADAGNARAMHNLAVILADGDGKPDYASAVIWFRKAAEYGVHDSQYNLGILLARGLGASQSLVQSYQWFAVAARENDADAATKRDEVAAKLSANDLAVAKALAAAFHPKTADVAATEITPPIGGWDGASEPSLVKSTRPKLSSL